VSDAKTLKEFLTAQSVDPVLTGLLLDLALTATDIAHIISRGPLSGGATGVADSVNVHDEVQKELDLIANDMLINRLDNGGALAGTASEEMEDIRITPEGAVVGPYMLVFDPLDGSSNVDINMSIGTIFSILRAPKATGPLTIESFLQPGTEQVAAGYFVYGPATQLMMTTGSGVNGFTLDRDIQDYVLSHENVTIPEATGEFAINAAYQRHWHAPVAQYVEDCLAGEDGPRGKNFNMRWIASLVAEVHRILNRGGVFLYPSDKREGRAAGHLRLLYEANPMAMLIEQAGGAATNGMSRIMELSPTGLHQRTPLVLGAREEVAKISELFHQAG
jgi:fructose-1,6-bisphosphatase I